MKIQVGDIFEIVSDDFYATKDIHSTYVDLKGRDAKIHLQKGERIEIRFPFAWNYRTEDDIYMHSTEKYILANCKKFGKVNPDIRSKNNAKLEEILRLELYEKEPVDLIITEK